MKKKNKAGTFFTPVVAVTGIFLAVIVFVSLNALQADHQLTRPSCAAYTSSATAIVDARCETSTTVRPPRSLCSDYCCVITH